jgi:hypothetical protein
MVLHRPSEPAAFIGSFEQECAIQRRRDSPQLRFDHRLRRYCSQRVHVSSFSIHRFSVAGDSADE